MTKFNSNPSIENKVESHPDRVENYEGGVAFKTSPKNELYLRTATWLVAEPKFYGDSITELSDIEALISKVGETDPEFTLKLAAYLRNEMYLRSAPQFLLVEALKNPESRKLARKWVPEIVKRADELTEALSIFIAKNGQIGKNGKGSLPNQFKLGLQDAFYNFNEYNFAKYKTDDKDVKLSDVLRLVHPKPRNDEENALFERIRKNTLKTPETWEVTVSEKGNNTEAWNEVIPKMGYMALLRNLRNIANTDASLEKVLERIVSPREIRRSKQFPFRFLSAHKIVNEINDPFKQKAVEKAIRAALTISADNIPKVVGRTYISTDVSSSMDDPVSGKSKMTCKEVGATMAAMAHRFSDNAIATAFATNIQDLLIGGEDLLADIDAVLSTNAGGSTNGYLVMQYLLAKNLKVDRIMVFTDQQMYDTNNSFYGERQNSFYEQYLKYKRTINKDVKVYLFDLTGYGTVQIPDNEPNIICIGGWSERIFDFVKSFEEDKTKALVKIESYIPRRATINEDAP